MLEKAWLREESIRKSIKDSEAEVSSQEIQNLNQNSLLFENAKVKVDQLKAILGYKDKTAQELLMELNSSSIFDFRSNKIQGEINQKIEEYRQQHHHIKALNEGILGAGQIVSGQ